MSSLKAIMTLLRSAMLQYFLSPAFLSLFLAFQPFFCLVIIYLLNIYVMLESVLTFGEACKEKCVPVQSGETVCCFLVKIVTLLVVKMEQEYYCEELGYGLISYTKMRVHVAH